MSMETHRHDKEAVWANAVMTPVLEEAPTTNGAPRQRSGGTANNYGAQYNEGVQLLSTEKTGSGEEQDEEETPGLFPGTSLVHQLSATLGTGLKPERTVGAIGLAFVAFVSVCGGPFGIEDAVGAAGPLITLVSLLVLGVFWSLPQALMTAELSTIYDENGGYIVWVYEALGPYWGFVNAVNSVASNVCDLPLYPVLYATYLSRFFHFGNAIEWVVKALALLLVVVLNVLGMEAVADSSLIFTIAVLLPFAVEPFFQAPDPSRWGETPAGGAGGAEWGVFMSVVLWNFQGWDSMGCIAGEVKNAKRSYPVGVCLATVLIILNYSIPIIVGLAVEPDWSHWGTDEGDTDFIDMAKQVSSWLGIWVVFGASFAVLGEFSAVVSSSSRALQSMASYRMVPKFLVKNRTRFATPVPSILFETVTTAVLMMFEFSTLVVLDTFFNNVSLVLEVIAFLRLKHQYPDMERPYAVPGRLKGAWLISIPKFLMIGYAWYSIGWSVNLLAGLGVNLLALLVGYWWAFRYLPRLEREAFSDRSRGDLQEEFEGPFGGEKNDDIADEDSEDADDLPLIDGSEDTKKHPKSSAHNGVTAPFSVDNGLLDQRDGESSRTYQDSLDKTFETKPSSKGGVTAGSPSATISPNYDIPLLEQRSASSIEKQERSPNHHQRSYGSFRGK
eukprot:gb/GECG01008569.1/.p1 GENE.gb/GECG01008569.1/~~gb/GECG01008569.1/.p1  ORF type:complete len:670 (+),score=59.03 gb/GECG01008569.1/:1-2010(+)